MNIDDIKRRLLVKYPLFGSIIANVKFIEEPLVETAGTDAVNIYYNPEFISNLTDKEQIFIFAHEVCHIAFNHIYRSEGKDHELWNIATDAVSNAHLKKDGLPLVKGGVDIPEAINYDAEEMYNKLLEEKMKNNSNQKDESKESNQNSSFQGDNDSDNINQSSSNSFDNQDKAKTNSNNNGETQKNEDVGHDTHSMWDKAIKKRHKQENEQSTKEEEKKSFENKKKLTDMGEKEIFKQNKAERKKQLEKLRESLVSQSYGASNTTDSNIRNISNIGESKPLIDWRYILKEAIKYDVDWSYKNATIEDGVLTSRLEEIPLPETEIVLDTSGSIDEELLKNFLKECKNILQTSKVKVGCFDTKFYGFTEIKDTSDIDNLSFYGGGGTNFDVAVNAFSKRVENKIIFTDGEASMPSNRMDAIWIVFGNRKINPHGGKVIYITKEQLDKLYSYKIEEQVKDKSR